MTLEAVTTRNRGIVVDSDTFFSRIESLGATPTGLVDVVGLYGSTQTNWRSGIIEKLTGMGVNVYNPQLGPNQWVYEKHAEPESVALANSSVIVFRLENKGLVDGSLGSMGEIGDALLSAILRGQRLVISLEEGFGKSLKTYTAVTQYASLTAWLAKIQNNFSEYVYVHRDEHQDNLEDIVFMARKSQKAKPLTRYPIRDPRYADDYNPGYSVLVGGSAGGYSEATKEQVRIAREQDKSHINGNRSVIDQTIGETAEAWKILDGLLKAEEKTGEISEDTASRVFFQLSGESSQKIDADMALWHIMPNAVSNGAVTEIGFLIALRMILGKRSVIFLEEFDAALYLRERILEKQEEIQIKIQEIESIGVNELTEEYREALDSIREVMNGTSKKSFKDLVSALRFMPVMDSEVQKAVAARRVRGLAIDHLKRIEELQEKLLDSNLLTNRMFFVVHSVEEYHKTIEEVTSPKIPAQIT